MKKFFGSLILVLVFFGLAGFLESSFVLADVYCGWECNGSAAVCKPGGDEYVDYGYGCLCHIWCSGDGCKTVDSGYTCGGQTACCKGQWFRHTQGCCDPPPPKPTSTLTPVPTSTPTVIPTQTATLTPTSRPTVTLTSVPTSTLTSAPTATPTRIPIPTPTSTRVPTLPPPPPASEGWFQAEGGDLQANGDLTSKIPSEARDKNLSLPGDGGYSGVVGYGEDINLGSGDVNRLANTSYRISNIGFDFFAKTFKLDLTDDLATEEIYLDESYNDGKYYSSKDQVSIIGSFPPGKKMMIFVKGIAKIDTDLVVPETEGSYLAVIAKEGLIFAGSVEKAQGFFLTDKYLTVESSDLGDTQFKGEGSFIGLKGIVFKRKLNCDIGSCDPAELFTERPDFYINAPRLLKITSSYFKEIVPE